MGTRNLTRVQTGGQFVIEQYCQWDGYPTAFAARLMYFIRDNDINYFRNLAMQSQLVVNDEHNTTATGFVIDDEMEALFSYANDIYYHELANVSPSSERDKQLTEILIDKYGKESFIQYQLANRDTGCSVLDLLLEVGHGLTFTSTPYLHNMDNLGDWQIEAVGTIDLDNEELQYSYHGQFYTRTFEEIKYYTDSDIASITEQWETEEPEYD